MRACVPATALHSAFLDARYLLTCGMLPPPFFLLCHGIDNVGSRIPSRSPFFFSSLCCAALCCVENMLWWLVLTTFIPQKPDGSSLSKSSASPSPSTGRHTLRESRSRSPKIVELDAGGYGLVQTLTDEQASYIS